MVVYMYIPTYSTYSTYTANQSKYWREAHLVKKVFSFDCPIAPGVSKHSDVEWGGEKSGEWEGERWGGESRGAAGKKEKRKKKKIIIGRTGSRTQVTGIKILCATVTPFNPTFGF